MTTDIAVRAKNISKIYKLYENPIDRLKESLHPFRKKYHRDFFALNGVSFEIAKGETVGIIGKNGSGKSTLLKLLTGVLTPSAGEVMTQGNVSALLELGAGFNPELTGVENVYFTGAIMGYSREEMNNKLDGILSFADIGDFVHQPVKTYSSGMFVRLGFAVAITVDPDILIVDEALAVGDIRFSQKCYRKIREFKEMNKTIIMVTHDTGAVMHFCDRAIWIRNGEIARSGDANEVVRQYLSYMAFEALPAEVAKADYTRTGHDAIPWEDVSGCSSYGEGGAKIRRVALCGTNGRASSRLFEGGQVVKFLMEVNVVSEIVSPVLGFVLNDERGNHVTGLNTLLTGDPVRPFHNGETIVAEFEFTLPHLRNGKYTLSSAIAEGTLHNHLQHHWVHDASVVDIVNKNTSAMMGWYIFLDSATVTIK